MTNKTDKDGLLYFTDPLQNIISVSSNEADEGDHPLKHWRKGVTRANIGKTITSPDYIYGHVYFSNRGLYVREHSGVAPDPVPKDPKQKTQITVVEYTGPNEGKVVTAFYTDSSSQSIDRSDVKYEANKQHKKNELE